MSRVIGRYQVEVTQAVERFDSDAMEMVCKDETYHINIDICQSFEEKITICDTLGKIASFDSIEEFLKQEEIDPTEITWL